MQFNESISWLKDFLIRNNYEKIAEQIKYDWCWKELGKFSKNVKQEVLDLVATEIIKSGSSWACYYYCRDIENRDDVREAIIKSGNGDVCYRYCRSVKDRDDVREALIKSGNRIACVCYCYDVKDRDDVRAAAEKTGYTFPERIK